MVKIVNAAGEHGSESKVKDAEGAGFSSDFGDHCVASGETNHSSEGLIDPLFGLILLCWLN